MTGIIALVGRPNVGKSTLFNRLTRSRDALVADRPGLTRDRIYGIGRVGGHDYVVIDTGGLEGESQGIAGQMSVQTRAAVDEADVVVLLTDARQGMNAQDELVAAELRRSGKNVCVAVNKAEGLPLETARADFFALGLGEPWVISAAHGDGVAAFMQDVLGRLPVEPEAAAVPHDEGAPRIAVVGRPNVGKSTLVNALLGEQRVVVYDEPGTTRDSIRINLQRGDRRYVLIDTAGVRRRARIEDTIEKFSVVKTLRAIEEANVVVLVLDAREGVGVQDAALAGFVLDAGRSMVLAVNKWDGLEPDQRRRVRAEIERKLPFLAFLEPHFISALHGSGIGDLFPAVDRAYGSAMIEVPTSRLNRILERAVTATPPPMWRGRPVKLKFAHQVRGNPPTFAVHGNLVEHVPDSYRRYLTNTLRRALELEGTPVRVEFRKAENPFAARQNRRGRRGPRRP